MATSRGGTPANPTLVATTDDAARGGLFARSNLGNTSGVSPTTDTDTYVVSGVVNGTDLILTLNNGDTVTITGLPDGSGSGGSGFMPQASNVILNNNDLQITFVDGSVHQVDLSTLMLSGTNINNANIAGLGISNTGTADAPELNLSLDELSAATSIQSTDNIAFVSGGTSQVISFDDFRTALNIGGANLDENDFVDTPTTTVTDGTTAGTVEIAANMLDSSGNAWDTLEVSSTLRGPNNRALELSLTGTTLTLQEVAAGPPPTPTPRGSVTPPAGSDIFEDPQPDQMTTIDVTNIMTIGTPTVTVMDPDGSSITPTVTTTPVNNNMATVTITVDGGDVVDPGEYDITATIPTTDEDGNAMDVTEMVNFNNFVPFVQSRSDIPDSTTLTGTTGVTRSSTAWTGTVDAISGSGSLYIAVNNADLNLSGNQFFAELGPFTRRGQIVRQVTVMAGTTSLTYNILRITAASPVTLTNFRMTR